ncbi:MAG: CmcI family methyltransferase [Actinomycetota bacterium]
MFPFWNAVLRPVLEAADARRVVEIGALAGENTRQLLDVMGDDAELHVIDPVPQFDPEEHARQFGGRYVFHRDLSHEVLPDLPACDVAFIDGDHNWFTVFYELQYLADAADRDGQPLPVCLLHDTFWPYGRRDLYYDPSNVPAEHRQPYKQKGMRPGKQELVPRGGLNPTMCNAELEGGERNGVMTAVDDFVDAFPRAIRRLDIPIYFGLTILAEEAYLERNPAVATVLDHLETMAGKDELLDLAEETRLRAMMFQHNVFFNQQKKEERARARYLDLLSSALVNRHYIDHEIRIGYLLERTQRKQAADMHTLRDPARPLKGRLRSLRMRRAHGVAADAEGKGDSWYPYAASGDRLTRLREILEHTADKAIPGDLVDVETGRGGTAIFMRGWLDAHEIADIGVWVAGRFRADTDADDHLGPDLNTVRDGFDAFDLLDERVRFLQGELDRSVASSELGDVAFLRIGAANAADVTTALEQLYPKLSMGATVFLDVFDDDSLAAAHAFRESIGEDGRLERLDYSGAIWQKTVDAPVAASTDTAPAVDRIALAPRVAATDTVDLSVVVVFYNMRREAQRTLHSLSRAYQEEMDGVDYEVIVVDNGSDPDNRLTDEEVRAFGPEFVPVDMGDDAPATPIPALVRGTEMSRGDVIAFMIDGAHVVTPKVLHYGLLGIETYGPAIVATQQWYVGPGQQNDAMLDGYNEEIEDKLFDQIEWPTNGYRLFEISSFIGDRDWFDGLWESNCLFASRSLVEQVGGFDDSFAMAGGGFANLDLFERLGSSPDANVVTILGEGSFHQTHGGTTTNQAEISERRRRIVDYRAHYAEIRKRPFRGPGKMVRYVGTLFGPAKRTKPRRLMSPHFARAAAQAGEADEFSTTMPLPDEMKTGFIDAFWRTEGWRSIEWDNHVIERAPTDLISYREIVEDVRPDHVIVIESEHTPSVAPFFASTCAAIGHGQVRSLGAARGEVEAGERLEVVGGTPTDDAVVDDMRTWTGGRPTLVVVGLDRVFDVTQALRAYQAMVTDGSYLIVESTIVNGNPVWTNFGPGPLEASKNFLRTHGHFMIDPHRERFGLTFNVHGFLKRRSGDEQESD